jgi:hypothetical protein
MARQSKKSHIKEVKEKDFCICLLMFLTSLLFTFSYRNEIKGMLLPRSAYSQVTGIVVESHLRTVESRGYASQIYYVLYKYQVARNSYCSDRINFWMIRTNGGIAAEEAVLSEYPLNKQVLVYYQRSDPGFAVLDPYVPLTTKVGLSILLFVLFLSTFGVVWSFLRWRKTLYSE